MCWQAAPQPSQCVKYIELKSTKLHLGSQLGPRSSQEGPSGSSVHVSHPGLRSLLVLLPEIVGVKIFNEVDTSRKDLWCNLFDFKMEQSRDLFSKPAAGVQHGVGNYQHSRAQVKCLLSLSWEQCLSGWTFFSSTSIQLREEVQKVYVKTIWHFVKQRRTETGRK